MYDYTGKLFLHVNVKILYIPLMNINGYVTNHLYIHRENVCNFPLIWHVDVLEKKTFWCSFCNKSRIVRKRKEARMALGLWSCLCRRKEGKSKYILYIHMYITYTKVIKLTVPLFPICIVYYTCICKHYTYVCYVYVCKCVFVFICSYKGGMTQFLIICLYCRQDSICIKY